MSANTFDRNSPVPFQTLTKQDWEAAQDLAVPETREGWERAEEAHAEKLERDTTFARQAGQIAIQPEVNWKTNAACKEINPSVFFPEHGEGVKIAIDICRITCPVMADCLSYAPENKIDHGVWGGQSERSRRRILRQRRLNARQSRPQ